MRNDNRYQRLHGIRRRCEASATALRRQFDQSFRLRHLIILLEIIHGIMRFVTALPLSRHRRASDSVMFIPAAPVCRQTSRGDT